MQFCLSQWKTRSEIVSRVLLEEFCHDSEDGKQDRQGFRANVKRQREKGRYVFLRENLENKCKKWENEGVSTVHV